MLRLLYHPPPPSPVREHASTRAVSSGVPSSSLGGRARPATAATACHCAHSTHTTPCKRRYLSLWVRLPDLHRVRPHYVDSTASRPICEVKLRQAGLVVWFVRTCEVLVLYFILQIFCEWLLQGGSLCWVRLPGSHQVLRDITALFFRLLLKKTVLSQSEGPDDFYPPSASGGPLIGLVG